MNEPVTHEAIMERLREGDAKFDRLAEDIAAIPEAA